MRSLLKTVLTQDSYAYRFFRKFYYWYKNIWLFDVFRSYTTYKKDIHFIQIGSNDGDHGDPLSDYITKVGWKGILVEPVPYLFEKLKSNYAASQGNLFFENSAIAAESGLLTFYRLEKSDTPDLPAYYDQLGSFKKEVVLKHRDCVPSFDDLFIEDTVHAITFRDLLKKYKVEKLNLVHIDTEGYDYEIINMIPFADIEIDLIMFEHRHLSVPEYKKAVKLLHRNGFRVQKKDHADTIAIKRHILRRLSSSLHASAGIDGGKAYAGSSHAVTPSNFS